MSAPDRSHVCVDRCRPNAHIAFEGRRKTDAERLAESKPELDRKIAEAYRTALTHSHQGGSVQIHVGTDMVDYLKGLASVPDDNPLPGPEHRLFGFPLIPAHDRARPDHVAVHVVHYVF